MRVTSLAVLLASCGPGDDDRAGDVAELHACDLLPASEMARIAGEAAADANVDVENNVGMNAMSQCTYTLQDPGRRVTVHLQRSAKPIGSSRETDAETLRAQDGGSDWARQMGDAVGSGDDIAGLGTLAYVYELDDSLHLVAYWDEHYKVWTWTSDESSERDDQLELLKQVATFVIDAT